MAWCDAPTMETPAPESAGSLSRHRFAERLELRDDLVDGDEVHDAGEFHALAPWQRARFLAQEPARRFVVMVHRPAPVAVGAAAFGIGARVQAEHGRAHRV